MSAPVIQALENTDIISSSGATPTQWGPHTIIDTDHGAIIDWSNFNTITGESVTFNQFLSGELSSTSAVLNRITSASATQFDGALSANGRVFVVNPAGIVFGAGSTVDVTQLVASGLNISNFSDVVNDPTVRMNFVGGDGDVVNYGIINADSVYLIGKNVMNVKTILAPNGLIVMAAGDNVYLGQDGSNVVVEVSDAGDGIADVRNRSRLGADGGTVVLAAADTFSRAIVNNGIITAYGASGTISLRAARVENHRSIRVDGLRPGSDAGSIIVSGVEEVVNSPDSLGTPAIITAGGGHKSGDAIGNGGTIIIESEGSVTLGVDSLISAIGGTEGDGGYIKITGEHFTIDPSSHIDASPQDLNFELGTLEIDPLTITVANGASLGATDTIYEQDIETLSTSGTNVIISAGDAVNVQDMTDDGEITGGVGSIELHATGASGSVSFANTDNTISTTSGNIAVTAGSGGINIGNLQTGDASSNPGQINVTTSDGGDVTIESLVITDGLGRAEISVDASGDLTVIGEVEVGSNSAINNVPSGQDAEAIISLSAGDNVVLNGDVTATAAGSNTGGGGDLGGGGVTKSYIGISGGTNNAGDGDVTINGDLVARATSTSNGTSDATIEIRAWNDIIFGPGAAMPLADADNGDAHVESFESAEQINPDGDVARIIIDTSSLEGFPDFGETHMGSTLTGNVLQNDVDSKGNPITATLDSGPSHAVSFTLNPDGSYSYTPQAGYVGDDTFTYTATADGDTTAPVLVTITMTNTLPVLSNDAVTTSENTNVGGNVLANDIDADGDPLSADLINGPANADSFTLNPDGSFSYTPADGFIGEDSFTYSAGDPETGATTGQATVTITVNEVSTTAPPAAPGVDVRVEPEISGYPALVKWVAVEIGVDERVIDIWFANTLTSVRDITPYEAYAKFKKAANVLRDRKGLHTDALAQLISEFASSTAPPTEEQMASVAEAIARNTEAGNVYALAGQYLDSFAEYVAFLVDEMGFSEADAAEFVTAKYVERLAKKNNVNVAAFVAARLANLYEDSID